MMQRVSNLFATMPSWPYHHWAHNAAHPILPRKWQKRTTVLRLKIASGIWPLLNLQLGGRVCVADRIPSNAPSLSSISSIASSQLHYLPRRWLSLVSRWLDREYGPFTVAGFISCGKKANFICQGDSQRVWAVSRSWSNHYSRSKSLGVVSMLIKSIIHGRRVWAVSRSWSKPLFSKL